MSIEVWFRHDIAAAIRGAVADAVNETADRIAANAKRRAPIRKVFKEKAGFRQRRRMLTQDERELAISRAQHYYTNVAPNEAKRRRAIGFIRNYAQVGIPTRGSANALASSRKLRVLGIKTGNRFTSSTGASRNRYGGYEPGDINPLLTSRGRGEIQSGRAIHDAPLGNGSQSVQVGGKLKASIGVASHASSKHPKAVIEAAIHYAKFVEFPTIHNRAQPFLLPALHDERDRFPREIANAIKSAIGG